MNDPLRLCYTGRVKHGTVPSQWMLRRQNPRCHDAPSVKHAHKGGTELFPLFALKEQNSVHHGRRTVCVGSTGGGVDRTINTPLPHRALFSWTEAALTRDVITCLEPGIRSLQQNNGFHA